MKRYFLILLLLPSLGFCSATHTYFVPDFVQAVNYVHRHSDLAPMNRDYHPNYNVRVPSNRYYPYGRYPRRPYFTPRDLDSYYNHEHSHTYGDQGRLHGHR